MNDPRRQRAPREFVDPRSEEEILLSRHKPSRDNFAARVAIQKQMDSNKSESKEEAEKRREEVTKERRKHLSELAQIAEDIAAKAADSGVEPEYSAQYKSYESKLVRKLSLQRQRKITKDTVDDFGQGWLLARKPAVYKDRMLVQEAMLGVDGKIRVFMRDDISNAASLLKRPSYSRIDVTNAIDQTIAPPWGAASIVGDKENKPLLCTVEDGSEYPFFGLGEEDDANTRSLLPETIQMGLENFVVENQLSINE